MWVGLLVCLVQAGTFGHDIPNARVDRSIQVTLIGSTVRVDYEVSLAELTLTQDLRALIGSLPGSDRPTWFYRYGQITGPLNARGFLVKVNGRPIELKVDSFDLSVEEHPRFVFHFSADLPELGRLSVQDTNYAASEGTSRLAIRAFVDVSIQGDDLPDDVTKIPIRPVWQLTDLEERRTKAVVVTYWVDPKAVRREPLKPSSPPSRVESSNGLTRLLDRRTSGLVGWLALGFAAVVIGATHSLQPGHGKTIASAASLGTDAPWRAAWILGLSTTLAHLSTVLLLAGALWVSGGSRFSSYHRPLAQAAGFVLAANGCFRLGRLLRRSELPERPEPVANPSAWALAGIGAAAGLVPCWEAIGLVVIAESIGRLVLGIYLLLGFSLGMGAVLIAVAGLSAKLGDKVRLAGTRPARILQAIGAVVLASVGLWLMLG